VGGVIQRKSDEFTKKKQERSEMKIRSIIFEVAKCGAQQTGGITSNSKISLSISCGKIHSK
jgi:hypothetical protein